MEKDDIQRLLCEKSRIKVFIEEYKLALTYIDYHNYIDINKQYIADYPFCIKLTLTDAFRNSIKKQIINEITTCKNLLVKIDKLLINDELNNGKR